MYKSNKDKFKTNSSTEDKVCQIIGTERFIYNESY